MKQKRLKHSADFKAKVAIEALREQSTLSELSTKYGVSQSVISRWKTELLNNASSVFGDTPTNNDGAAQKERDNLHRKIGELEMKLDFAKRVSRQLGISIPEDF
jgi:transposase-like protein